MLQNTGSQSSLYSWIFFISNIFHASDIPLFRPNLRDFAVCSTLRVMASPQACNFDLRDSADAIHVKNDPQSVCGGGGGSEANSNVTSR